MNRREFAKLTGALILPQFSFKENNVPKIEWIKCGQNQPHPDNYCVVYFDGKFMFAKRSDDYWTFFLSNQLGVEQGKLSFVFSPPYRIKIKDYHQWLDMASIMSELESSTLNVIKRNEVYLILSKTSFGNFKEKRLSLAVFSEKNGSSDTYPVGVLGFKDHQDPFNECYIFHDIENDTQNSIGNWDHYPKENSSDDFKTYEIVRLPKVR